jgi:hypothetical protein
MDTGKTTDSKAGSKASSEHAEPSFEGVVGTTRREAVHVTIPGGLVRSVEVFIGVNLATNPELREVVLAGALHRFEGGEELAIPYVLHDPRARKLALVLPPSLRHRELEERSKLLSELARDTKHLVPAYVRDAPVLFGAGEVQEFLTRPSRDPSAAVGAASAEKATALAEREAELARRETELTRREAELARDKKELASEAESMRTREQRLKSRAEDVTRQEDELRELGEMLEAQQADLTMREQELERRFATVLEREKEAPVEAARRPSSHPPPIAHRSQPIEAPVEPAAFEPDEIDDIEPVSTDTSGAAAGVQMIEDGGSIAESIADAVEEIVDDDDVEELDEKDVVQEVTGVTTAPEPTTDELRLDDVHTVIGQSGSHPKAAVTPPTRFLDDRSIEMVAKLDGGVWLFARLDEGHESAFREGSDLLVQLVNVQGTPVVLLSLVDASSDGRPYVRRAALDPRNTDDARVLTGLRADFEATVALFSASGRFERTVEVSAPRADNVGMVIERVNKTPRSEARTDAATALDRALTAPPPVREDGHPFVGADAPPAKNAGDAANALARLVDWSSEEKLDRALLTLSIPKPIVDATETRILEEAVSYGLALTPNLEKRAIALGIAADEGALVNVQLERFQKTAALSDRGGLSPEDVADNWQHLLDAATENEIAIDEDTHELAWNSIRKVRGEASDSHVLADVDPSKLPEMGKLELAMLLDHPKLRQRAALELCRRGDPDVLDRLAKAVRKMPRAEVVRVVPKMTAMGEAAGDALIDLLGARKTFVRQAAALGLGELDLRRAVVPLMHVLTSEASDVWREVARVIGELGSPSFRTVQRALKDPEGHEERFKVVLAHLANHGCESQVDKLTKDSDKGVAVIALEALTLRQDLRIEADEIRGKRPFTGEDPVKRFSHRYYQEMAGTAPEADLA